VQRSVFTATFVDTRVNSFGVNLGIIEGSSSGGTGITGQLKKLNACIVNNAKNYSIGGVANLISNTQIPGSGLLGNSITDTYTLLTGQDGLLSSAWNAAKTGVTWALAANPRMMTNGPNSFTTINPALGSPQAILGNGNKLPRRLGDRKKVRKERHARQS
jgi:hypothetical protein